MYYYFTSQNKCALKLNGIYLGVITGVIKHVNIISDDSLVELIPLNSGLPVFSFTLNSEFLTNPPSQISVTNMKGGYLIVYNPSPANLPFNVIEQKKYDDFAVTVFCDGSYKISIETSRDFFTENINFDFESVEIKKCGDVLLVGLLGNQSGICAYRVFPKIMPLTKRACNEFSFDNQIITRHEYPDIAKHTVTLTWSVSGGDIKAIDKKITCSDSFSINNLPAKVIPYAFLEELLVGGNIDSYLASNIKPNADKLRGFFGSFIGVMPPPFFVSPEQIGLIYKKSANLYSVEYCSFELNGRLISGIKK